MGKLNRQNLRRLIQLEMKSLMDGCHEGVMVVVIPLLVEKQLWGPFDRAVVVDCENETQINRLMERDKVDAEKAKAMLLAQASREQRLRCGQR